MWLVAASDSNFLFLCAASPLAPQDRPGAPHGKIPVSGFFFRRYFWRVILRLVYCWSSPLKTFVISARGAEEW